MTRVRRLFGVECWGKTKHTAEAKSVAHASIRKQFGVHTLFSILRKRRLKWFRLVMMNPEEHSQYLASLFGSFDWEEPELEDGKPHKDTIAPLVQLYNDMCAAFQDFQGFTGDWVSFLVNENEDFDRVLSFTYAPSEVINPHPDTQGPSAPAEEGDDFVIDTVGFNKHVCPDCAAPFLTWQECLIHRRTKHHYKAKEGDLVLPGNKCPWCLNPFADKSGAIRHIRSNWAREVCRTTGGPANRKSITQNVPERGPGGGGGKGGGNK